MNDARYVVAKRTAGLGDLLVSLSSAWWYAKHTKRELVVDWRNSTYDLDHEKNLLSAILEPPQVIDGVSLHGDLSKLEPLISSDFYPSSWNRKNLCSMAWETPEHKRVQRKLITELKDRKERVVVFSECLANLIPSKEQETQFFRQLQFDLSNRQIANTFAKVQFGDKQLIGLHIRHGNGGNIMGHKPYWTNAQQSLAKCCEWLRRCIMLCAQKPYAIFLATDSIWIEQHIKSSFSNVIVYPKKHRAIGNGELHRGNTDENALKEALIEMLLLAKSHLLMRFPPGSFFSHYASMVKPSTPLYPKEWLPYDADSYNPKIVF